MTPDPATPVNKSQSLHDILSHPVSSSLGLLLSSFDNELLPKEKSCLGTMNVTNAEFSFFEAKKSGMWQASLPHLANVQRLGNQII